MEEEKIVLDGNEEKIIVKLPKDEFEDNTIKRLLDDTIDLTNVVKEIKDDKE